VPCTIIFFKIYCHSFQKMLTRLPDNACGCNKTAPLLMLVMYEIFWIFQMFLNCWIERDGLVSWPLRLPDLILDFLGSYLKSIVYQEQSTTPDDMRTRMDCASIPVMTLMQAERAFTERLRLCMHMRRCKFEHYK